MKYDRSENPIFRYARGEGRDDRRGLGRREMMHQLLTGAAGSAALASMAKADPGHGSPAHASSAAPLAGATESDGAAEWTPQFLDAHQSETLSALAERIVPGSAEARINRLIDLLLTVDVETTQRKFLQSLSAFDAEAIQRHRQPFAALTEDQQNQILTGASQGALGQRPQEWYETGSDVANPPGDKGPMTLRNHFENIKEWVVRCYFNSEAGLKDLGWTGRVMWDSFPSCEHPGGHK